MGMSYCTPDYPEGDCYSRDFTQIDCDEKPRYSRCVGYTGMDGLIFCDLDKKQESQLHQRMT